MLFRSCRRGHSARAAPTIVQRQLVVRATRTHARTWKPPSAWQQGHPWACSSSTRYAGRASSDSLRDSQHQPAGGQHARTHAVWRAPVFTHCSDSSGVRRSTGSGVAMCSRYAGRQAGRQAGRRSCGWLLRDGVVVQSSDACARAMNGLRERERESQVAAAVFGARWPCRCPTRHCLLVAYGYAWR